MKSNNFYVALTIILNFLVTHAFAEDPYRDLWNTYLDSIKGYEITFDFEENNKAKKTIILGCDFPGLQWKGKYITTRLSDNNIEETIERDFGSTSDYDWEAYRYDNDFRRVDISQSNPIKDSRLASLGAPQLRYCFGPFHTLVQKGSILDTDFSLVKEVELEGENKRRLVYQAELEGYGRFNIEYDINLEEGVRVYETNVYWNDDKVYEIINSDFTRSNGFWVPRKSYFWQSAKAGSREIESTLNIARIEMNPQFSDDYFKVAIIDGDLVYDHIASLRYYKGAAPEPIEFNGITENDSMSNLKSEEMSNGNDDQVAQTTIEKHVTTEKKEYQVNMEKEKGKKGEGREDSDLSTAKKLYIFIALIILLVATASIAIFRGRKLKGRKMPKS